MSGSGHIRETQTVTDTVYMVYEVVNHFVMLQCVSSNVFMIYVSGDVDEYCNHSPDIHHSSNNYWGLSVFDNKAMYSCLQSACITY